MGNLNTGIQRDLVRELANLLNLDMEFRDILKELLGDISPAADFRISLAILLTALDNTIDITNPIPKALSAFLPSIQELKEYMKKVEKRAPITVNPE